MARTVFASPAARAALTLVVFLVLPDGVEDLWTKDYAELISLA